jgi:hypothetical protein
MAPLVASAIDVVVHLRRTREGRREVSDIATLGLIDGRLDVVPVWSLAEGVGSAGRELARRLAARAVSVPAVLS